MVFALKILVSATVIATASWLSGRYSKAAGLLVALPLASSPVLPMSYMEHRDARVSLDLARSILIALPSTLIFFASFLAAGRLGIGFWAAYGFGCLLLPIAFLIHEWLARALGVK